MDIVTIGLWIFSAFALIISYIKRKEKTVVAVKMAKGMIQGMIGQIIGILLLIGLILNLLPPETVTNIANRSGTLVTTVFAAVLGSITLIPAFVAFPLVGSLVRMGTGVVPAAAFLTTLTMVGVVTFPMEKKEFGLKFTIYRNALSFIFAVGIALLMGVVL
jgi:uncharacterized membrane protein YraQ (UPF0718 family)